MGSVHHRFCLLLAILLLFVFLSPALGSSVSCGASCDLDGYPADTLILPLSNNHVSTGGFLLLEPNRQLSLKCGPNFPTVKCTTIDWLSTRPYAQVESQQSSALLVNHVWSLFTLISCPPNTYDPCYSGSNSSILMSMCSNEACDSINHTVILNNTGGIGGNLFPALAPDGLPVLTYCVNCQNSPVNITVLFCNDLRCSSFINYTIIAAGAQRTTAAGYFMRVTNSADALQLLFYQEQQMPGSSRETYYLCTRQNGCSGPYGLLLDPNWKLQLLDAPAGMGEFMTGNIDFTVNGNYSLVFDLFANETATTSTTYTLQVPSASTDPLQFPPSDPQNGIYTAFAPDGSAAVVWYFAGCCTTGSQRIIWLITCENQQPLFGCANFEKTLVADNGPYNGDIVISTTPELYLLAYTDYCTQGGRKPVAPLTCPVSNFCCNAWIHAVVVNRTDLSMKNNSWDLTSRPNGPNAADLLFPHLVVFLLPLVISLSL